MGMDHWLEYDYVDKDGDEIEYEFAEWRKEYWINEVICKYIGNDYDSGEYEITLKDVIALRNFFQLCLDNPQMMNIVAAEGIDAPSEYTLVNSVKEINDFLCDFDTENLTGKLYYIISL